LPRRSPIADAEKPVFPSTRWPARLHDPIPVVLGALAAIAGAAAAIYYARVGLALSHYDARAHLVVARRILDSLTPGWQQIGAVWLPLPHVLDALPVQIDALYRSGAAGTAISVLSTAAAVWAIAAIVLRKARSAISGVAGAVLFTANPNVLYLQSTPMTEPLLFATTLIAVWATIAWLDSEGLAKPTWPGLALVAACMTRYEAWPITAAIVGLSGVVLLRRGVPVPVVLRACLRLTLYPVTAVAIFMANSRWTVGAWFISSGFYVAENEARGHLATAWQQVREGAYHLSGDALIWSAYAGAVLVVVGFVRSRERASLALVLAPLAAGVLPLYAYFQGHPLRVRYSVPLVAAAAAVVAAGIGLLPRRLRPIVSVIVIALAVYESPPFERTAPMIVEAQRDAVHRVERQRVTDYLVQNYDGGLIMMSMGSLAHYMFDLSANGFAIHDFLHEGNGELWPFAMQLGPRGFVTWVAVEEQAEGGDALCLRGRLDPTFFDGFERVAEGGGVALYRAKQK
jgi:hypothetical protein